MKNIIWFFLGLFLGFFNYWNFGSIYLGEIFLLVYVLLSSYRKGKKVKYNSFVTFLLIFYSLYILTYYFHNIISYYNILKYVLKYIIVLIEITIICNISQNKIKEICMIFIGYVLGSNIIGAYEFSQYNYLYRLIHVVQFSLFAILFMFSKKLNNKLKLIVLIVSLLFSFIGVSRTNMLISSILLAYHIYKNYIVGVNKNKTVFIKKIVLLSMGCILTFNLINYISNNLSGQTASNNERRILIEIAQREIKDNIWFGVGPANSSTYAINSYGYGYKLKDDNIGIHNIYLEIFAETGIIGISIIMLIYMYLYISLKRNYCFEGMLLYLYLLVFYFFNTFSGTGRFCFSMLIGLILYKIEEVKNNEKKGC